MSGVNKVILIGHLGKDPEVRRLENGDAVANFSLATSETWKDRNTGEKKEKTEWHNVVTWRKLAEVVEKYVKKGTQVYIEGKLQTRSWEKDGVTRYTTEILCNNLTMLGGGQQAQQAAPQAQEQAQQTTAQPGSSDELDDLPF